MDTTHDPDHRPAPAVDAALAELDAADPAGAPEAAERVADALTAALETAEELSAGGSDSEAGR